MMSKLNYVWIFEMSTNLFKHIFVIIVTSFYRPAFFRYMLMLVSFQEFCAKPKLSLNLWGLIVLIPLSIFNYVPARGNLSYLMAMHSKSLVWVVQKLIYNLVQQRDKQHQKVQLTHTQFLQAWTTEW